MNAMLALALELLSLFPMAGNMSAADKPALASKPNIILIYSDDHGHAGLGAQRAAKNPRGNFFTTEAQRS